MITICPQCQLPLAVTAADLRVAQGQVRCGRCAAVFNALASLFDPGGGTPERRPPVPAGGLAGPAVAATGPAPGPLPAERPASGALPPPPAGPRPATPSASRTVADARPPPAPDSAVSGAGDAWRTTVYSPASSGLFRTPPRDDEPRFDDTHGADDWPPDTPAATPAPEPVSSGLPGETALAAEGGADQPDTTDAFPREALRVDALDLDLGPPPDPDPPQQPTPTPGPDRDWAIDTMTAAELAALVARAEGDEPPELASIRIAVDDASEITVLPSESPATSRDAAPSPVSAPAQRQAPDAAGDEEASLPRLGRATDDDPDIAGARRAAAERLAAAPPGASTLRWLELEPAPPATAPLPATMPDAAAAATAASAAATSADAGVASPADAGAATPDEQPLAIPDDDPRTNSTEESPPGALAAALGLDAPWPAPAPAADAADAVVAELAGDDAARTAGAPRWMWAATLLLAVALAAQLVHLYREELAAQPALREPLARLYAGLGRPLEPRWELGRYELRQQGVVAEPVAAGTLTVRASIRNGAARAQPAPLLRVTLQDRFGNRIATRDLTPREYGGTAAIAPAPMLAPGQRIDAEVSLLDPGGEAVGFELDVCLRRPGGALACANDAPAAHG